MSSKVFSCILIIFSLFLILLPLQSQAVSTKSSSFEFPKRLQGSHKGDQVEGIHELKEYLERFGYLDHNNNNQSHAHDDTFDDLLSLPSKHTSSTTISTSRRVRRRDRIRDDHVVSLRSRQHHQRHHSDACFRAMEAPGRSFS